MKFAPRERFRDRYDGNRNLTPEEIAANEEADEILELIGDGDHPDDAELTHRLQDLIFREPKREH